MSQDAPANDDPIVTPEMASAGRAVLVDYLHDDAAPIWELPDAAIAQAYIAMERVRMTQAGKGGFEPKPPED